jgi:hypothetical protein
MAGHSVKLKTSAENRSRGGVKKNKIYRRGKVLKTVSRIILWAVFGLLILCVTVFFVFKSWTVYDSDGAHIIFPWADTRPEASNGIS